MITTTTINDITTNTAGTASSWRLVYITGSKVATLIEAEGITSTIHNIEEFGTEVEGVNRIAELGMTRKVNLIRTRPTR